MKCVNPREGVGSACNPDEVQAAEFNRIATEIVHASRARNVTVVRGSCDITLEQGTGFGAYGVVTWCSISVHVGWNRDRACWEASQTTVSGSTEETVSSTIESTLGDFATPAEALALLRRCFT